MCLFHTVCYSLNFLLLPISMSFQESGPLESEAMVMGVLNESFDVLVLRYGVQKRIYCNVSMTSDSLNGVLENRAETINRHTRL